MHGPAVAGARWTQGRWVGAPLTAPQHSIHSCQGQVELSQLSSLPVPVTGRLIGKTRLPARRAGVRCGRPTRPWRLRRRCWCRSDQRVRRHRGVKSAGGTGWRAVLDRAGCRRPCRSGPGAPKTAPSHWINSLLSRNHLSLSPLSPDVRYNPGIFHRYRSLFTMATSATADS